MQPLDPQWLCASVNTENPALFPGWLGAMLSPDSYGELWQGFLTYLAPGTVAAPPSSYGTANPFHPNA